MTRPTYGAFREGLPSVEDVRAHEERGGLWLERHPERRTFSWSLRSSGSALEFVLDNDMQCRVDPEWHARSSFRPVDADGYALPWLDEEVTRG